MLPIHALANHTHQNEPLLAYVARIYYPPRDKRISHLQLYISDLHGRHRKQLTHDVKDIHAVQWDGQDRLVWLETSVERKPKGDVAYHDTVYTSKLRPFKPTVIGHTDDAWDYEEVGFRRGSAVFEFGDKFFAARNKRLSMIPKNQLGKLTNAWEDEQGNWLFSTGRRLVENDDFELIDGTNKRKLPQDTDGFGHYSPIANLGDTFIVRGEFMGEYHAQNTFIWSLAWKTGQLTELVRDLGGIDFDPNSQFYAGTSFGGRGLLPYDKERFVWGAKLYAGNWKTGKRWLVLGGIVDVTDVAVQPQ